MGAGRRIHATCLGSGSPTVLFEPGGEGSMLSWQKVQPAVTAMTRTCFYDRAGMGYSDPPAAPITAISVTDEMRAVLAKLGVKSPVVIVGHSIGGFYATVFADRFPADVAGLVLIDPGFANQVDPRPPESLEVDRQHIRSGEAHLLECAALARAGKLALTGNGCMSYPPPHSRAETTYLTHIVTHPYWYEAEYDQSRHYFVADIGPSADTLEEWRVKRELGDLPVIVLSASDPPMRPWNTPTEQAAQREDWQAGHRALAARSKAGRWRLVPNSDHFIQLSQPHAVIGAVRDVVLSVRRQMQRRH
ncbi:alpha/beta hydrolase [Phenylobacterium sp.]|uniref:alpha/beta fold hydrolase n=1 Tax=Phenylobacterium sp. TaxID=1871053 RepID=UPI00286BE239|nr:alpha/beta hydrolase [Phenylobacterium sp.]